MALTLVRHTRPAHEGVCIGRTDVPLAPGFAAEAAAVAAALGPVARIASSPLARCRRLAEVLGAATGAPVALDPRLAEMDFGAWEGRRWDAIPRAELDAWAADLTGARPHGGESVAMLLERTRAALADCREADGPWLVVSHAGVIRAALFAAGDPDAWQRPVGFGEIVRIGTRASE